MNTVSYPHCTAEASIAGGGPSKHKCYLSSLNTVSYPHRTAEASIAGGGPSKHVSHTPLVAPTPSLTAEANIASGEPVDLVAAEPARLMLLRHAP